MYLSPISILTFLSIVNLHGIVLAKTYTYTTKFFEVPLDHFGYQRSETFKIKYLENEDYWDQNRGPIFFYTGNEGQIEVFASHTGFMWEIAQEYKAKIVFAEHRYYGVSMPFGNKSLEKEYVGYLTSSQALADYADLINYLQGNVEQPTYPVIAFGGSYGGMLAAYIRMKYPHLVAGSIAASAPIHMFPGMVPCNNFNIYVTYSFGHAVPGNVCEDNIRRSWKVLRNYTSTAKGSAALKASWNLCDPVNNATQVDLLVEFLSSMYTTLAMVNYPFASEFLVPLPANPVRFVCQFLNTRLEGEKLLEGIGKVLNTYSNYNKKNASCVDFKQGDDYGNLDASGWDYQACTEMVMPMCSDGVNDMFEPQHWNLTAFTEECRKKYGVGPRVNDSRITYGGTLLQAASNIVFSNGLLDPWTAGGLISSRVSSIEAVLIPGAAHHLDLMPASPEDPSSVVEARRIHKQNIEKWINDFYNKRNRMQRPWQP